MDELDRLIVQALQKDGRTPFTHIAKRAGVSETTIRTRYQGLVKRGMVRTVGIANPHGLGYQAPAIIAISTEPGSTGRVAKAIAQLVEVSYLVTTLGSYDLIAEVFCRDVPHLTEVVTQQIHPIPGVRATETLMIADNHKERCYWLPELQPEVEAP
jgi:Lrp/AsnC family transcriptional regulator for asnA, asnC and gidA